MSQLDDKIKLVLKKKCESDFGFFVQFMFETFWKKKFNVQPFHRDIFRTLMRVYNGECSRLIINIPPRHGKTEIIKMFVAWLMIKNPESMSMILSFSDKLAIDNAAFIRNYIQHEEIQRLWPISLQSDRKGKAHWTTVDNGEVYAASTGGQVTGRGAGRHGSIGAEGGVLIIDDPLKPDDANYDTRRNHVNDLFVGTASSRLNGSQTPVIVIMQRIHEEDLSGFLLDGGFGDDWEHLKIPVWDEDKNMLWPEAFSKEAAEIMNRSQPYYFAGQYLQEPAPLEGGMWKKEWFEVVNKATLPQNIKWEMFVDGAYTKDTSNDPTGILIAGLDRETKTTYILHNEGAYLEMPELLKHVKTLKDKFNVKIVLAEPKASGKTLVQMLRSQGVAAAEIKSRWVHKSKIDKANDVAPQIEGGKVKLVQGDWIPKYLKQVSTFPNAKHDEDIDNTSYAVERYLLKRQLKVY